MDNFAIFIGSATLSATAFIGGNYLARYLYGAWNDKALEAHNLKVLKFFGGIWILHRATRDIIDYIWMDPDDDYENSDFEDLDTESFPLPDKAPPPPPYEPPPPYDN